MRADNFVALTSLCAFVAISLFGCASEDTRYFLTEYSFLSSWLQAFGSLAAVWATYSIYRLSSRESEERERKKEEKLEIAMEEAKKAAAERHALMARVEFLSDEKLKDFFHEMYFYVNSHKITMSQFSTDSIESVSPSFILYLAALKKNIKPLNKEMLTKLADIHGNHAVEMQKCILLLAGCINNIKDLIDGYNQSKTYYELEHQKPWDGNNLNIFNQQFRIKLDMLDEHMTIIEKEFNVISVYARIN